MKNPANPASARDTSPSAADLQVKVLWAMSASRKVALVEDANRTARQLALAGIALRFPAASAKERVRLLMDIVLGVDLAEQVYGPGAVTQG